MKHRQLTRAQRERRKRQKRLANAWLAVMVLLIAAAGYVLALGLRPRW